MYNYTWTTHLTFRTEKKYFCIITSNLSLSSLVKTVPDLHTWNNELMSIAWLQEHNRKCLEKFKSLKRRWINAVWPKQSLPSWNCVILPSTSSLLFIVYWETKVKLLKYMNNFKDFFTGCLNTYTIKILEILVSFRTFCKCFCCQFYLPKIIKIQQKWNALGSVHLPLFFL